MGFFEFHFRKSSSHLERLLFFQLNGRTAQLRHLRLFFSRYRRASLLDASSELIQWLGVDCDVSIVASAIGPEAVKATAPVESLYTESKGRVSTKTD